MRRLRFGRRARCRLLRRAALPFRPIHGRGAAAIPSRVAMTMVCTGTFVDQSRIRMVARHGSVDALGEPPILLAKGRQRLFGCGDRVVRGQAGRDRQGADLRARR